MLLVLGAIVPSAVQSGLGAVIGLGFISLCPLVHLFMMHNLIQNEK